eukprot:CAMPEP_0113843088 /NCGR_PEP_ID=MMETSP0328-20130328/13063_1 /TAXON_ID=39455 /ORGANISM="Alexandrium minutum" /LENGTH=52 /DNA_ID=CAMNT_0000812019 /DNA_START=26 /DNA_END=181 /DNA_ORIENTATION=- /assembly_acc=CAM_ASM_000350
MSASALSQKAASAQVSMQLERERLCAQACNLMQSNCHSWHRKTCPSHRGWRW